MRTLPALLIAATAALTLTGCGATTNPGPGAPGETTTPAASGGTTYEVIPAHRLKAIDGTTRH